MRIRTNKNDIKALEKTELLKTNINLNNYELLEIGMGKGQMLLKMAKNEPQKMFLGLEMYSTVAAKAIRKIDNAEIKNVNVMIEDCRNLLNFTQGKIKLIWLTFSDPWPKKRHHKRRLTSSSFLEIYSKVLTKDGVLKLKTDNQIFFDWSIESFEKNNWKINYKTRDLHQSSIKEFNFLTEYEGKWIRQGKKIFYLEAIFIGDKN